MEAYYQYSGGQRVRKYVDKDSIYEERIYLGNFELYHKFESAGSLIVERQTVHINDDTGRITMLERRTYGSAGDDNDTDTALTRYIYSNHLQSANLELDDQAEIISYEEYHPYGTTAYQAMNALIKATAKRYRYTGKERDEESGLYYHGARYYISWLCRWSASDPLERKYAGWSPYNYGNCNPVTFNDPSGMGGEDTVKGVQFYEVADAKGQVPNNTVERVGKTFDVHSSLWGDPYRVVPSYSKDSDGNATVLSHYTAYSPDRSITEKGVHVDYIPMFIIGKDDLNSFRKNISSWEFKAFAAYDGGRLTSMKESQFLHYAGATPQEVLNAQFTEFKEEWKGALKDPSFLIGVALRVSTMKGKSPNNKISKTINNGENKYNFTTGSSFERRHVASKVRLNSIPKKDSTVALKGLNYKQDVSDINAGLAKEIKDATYGKVFKLKNGNRYYIENNSLKPLEGGGYVTLSRQEFKILAELNAGGAHSSSLQKAIINSETYSYKQLLKAMNVYLKSR